MPWLPSPTHTPSWPTLWWRCAGAQGSGRYQTALALEFTRPPHTP